VTEKHARILLTSIVKDDSEAPQFERMLRSFMPHVDGVAVLANGLSGKFENIKTIVEHYKGTLYTASPKTHPSLYSTDEQGPFFASFAAARSTLFELCDTGNWDYYTWADVDDIIVNGEQLRRVADLSLKQSLDQVLFPYWYAINIHKDGSFNESDVMIDHLRERLIKPKIFTWTSRLHEVVVAKDKNYKPKISMYQYMPKEGQTCVWAHINENERVTENMKRNIRILELQAKEEDYKDPRTIFYIAKTNFDLNTPETDEKAEKLIEKYLELSGWSEERSNAWEYLAKIAGRRQDHHYAITCLHSAIQEYPMRHMPYLMLAAEYAEIGLFDISDHWLDTASRMDAPTARTTIGNPLEIKFMLASLMYNRAMRRQKIDEAITWMEKRNAFNNGADTEMLATLRTVKEANDAARHILEYAKWLKKTNNVDRIPSLVQALTKELGQEPFAVKLMQEFAPPKTWPKKSIVYIATFGGKHFEEWSPKNLETGIGGSETAVIELSRRWAKDGYDVTVYGDPGDNVGDYEGVHYRPWYELNFKDTFDTVILWRNIWYLDQDIKAKKIYLDLHDVAANPDFTPERIKKLSGVFFKSKFHRSMVPNVPDNKAFVIGNGINL
jgi:tetratricopeptide (TPR) repeat protein